MTKSQLVGVNCQWLGWLWRAAATCLISGSYWVTAALSKSSKCWSVRAFRFLDLLLFRAENPASHTYVLPNIVSIFLQHLDSSGKSFTSTYFIQKLVGVDSGESFCMLFRALLCCNWIIFSCSAASLPPSSFILEAISTGSESDANGFSTKRNTEFSGRMSAKRVTKSDWI